MSSYQFLEVEDVEADMGFDHWLFHERKHALLQAPDGWRIFAIKKKDKIVAQVRFYAAEGIARASVKSPFGTIQFIKELPPDVLFSFIQFYEIELKKLGVDSIIIKNPPTDYAPFQNELLTVSLLNLGYTIENAEVGAVLPIKDVFENKLDNWEQRKLRQAEEGGLLSKQFDIHRLEEIYTFILNCREERDQKLSLTYTELKRIVDAYPDRFILHGILENEKLAAASICIRINTHILYNFYSAHAKEYDQVSPAVLLIKAVYEFCLTTKIKLLDLGTSALDGKPNFGLLDFKIRLGGKPSPKYTFHKRL